MGAAPLTDRRFSPTFLRSLTTVHAHDMRVVVQENFWRDLLPTLTFLPHLDAAGQFTDQMEDVFTRLNPELRSKVRGAQLFLLQDIDRPVPNECLISVHPETNEVGIRIFGRYLTDLQGTSEWFIHRLLDAPEHFVITPHTRCFILIDVHGERTDLLSGHVIPQRHRLWPGFYREYFYSVNITAAVLLLTLLVVLLVTPDGEHSPLGKFYGVCGRILSAALMNVFLLMGQFYSYRRSRRVVEWEKP